jgi:hypothetical protein
MPHVRSCRDLTHDLRAAPAARSGGRVFGIGLGSSRLTWRCRERPGADLADDIVSIGLISDVFVYGVDDDVRMCAAMVRSTNRPRSAPRFERSARNLRFLPPYTPDFNPIELVFAKLKAFLRPSGHRVTTTVERVSDWRRTRLIADRSNRHRVEKLLPFPRPAVSITGTSGAPHKPTAQPFRRELSFATAHACVPPR